MSGNDFCERLEALSAVFDGDPEIRKENLAAYVQHCKDLPPEKLTELKRQLIKVIGGLAQIDTRLADHAAHKR
jgi:hypothetical protein